MNEFKATLLKAPPSQLDPSLLPLIEKWSEPPRAIEILEVLDQCVNGALASDFVVQILSLVYQAACVTEGVTHESLLPQAHWRKDMR